jgi:hypothetical protein
VAVAPARNLYRPPSLGQRDSASLARSGRFGGLANWFAKIILEPVADINIRLGFTRRRSANDATRRRDIGDVPSVTIYQRATSAADAVKARSRMLTRRATTTPLTAPSASWSGGASGTQMAGDRIRVAENENPG